MSLRLSVIASYGVWIAFRIRYVGTLLSKSCCRLTHLTSFCHPVRLRFHSQSNVNPSKNHPELARGGHSRNTIKGEFLLTNRDPRHMHGRTSQHRTVRVHSI